MIKRALSTVVAVLMMSTPSLAYEHLFDESVTEVNYLCELDPGVVGFMPDRARWVRHNFHMRDDFGNRMKWTVTTVGVADDDIFDIAVIPNSSRARYPKFLGSECSVMFSDYDRQQILCQNSSGEFLMNMSDLKFVISSIAGFTDAAYFTEGTRAYIGIGQCVQDLQ